VGSSFAIRQLPKRKAMKTILIPSDFSVQSLDFVEHLLRKFQPERVNLLLFHLFELPDSITELLLLGREQKDFPGIRYEFLYRCRQLELAHRKQLEAIRTKCFYGNTLAIFRNFLEGHQVDLIAHPANTPFRKLGKASLDPGPFIDKCGKEVLVLTPPLENEADTFSWQVNLLLNPIV
jgi:hypothetical protein